MAQTARASRTRLRRGAAPVLPEDLVVWEILVRLPAKELLRCRAVCRSWRFLTAAADFLLAHHRHQPSLPLFEFLSQKGRSRGVFNAFLDTFDIRRSPAERRPVLRFNDYHPIYGAYRVHTSCDGLLLLSLCNTRYYICNPTTRQWISLPKLTKCSAYGLYPHSSSGEYRILYGNLNSCYVLTVGSSMAPRCVWNYPEVSDLHYVRQCQSVLLHGSLHWIRYVGDKMLVFHTVGESFWWMSVPACDGNWPVSELAQMDGTLGISQINKSRTMMKLWMLQNYEAEVWQMKYTIKFPVVEMSSITNDSSFNVMALSENGDVLVYCYGSSYIFHCDNTGKLLQKFQLDHMSSCPTGQWFKESLVQHAFFQKNDGRRVRKPRFFRGL